MNNESVIQSMLVSDLHQYQLVFKAEISVLDVKHSIGTALHFVTEIDHYESR